LCPVERETTSLAHTEPRFSTLKCRRSAVLTSQCAAEEGVILYSKQGKVLTSQFTRLLHLSWGSLLPEKQAGEHGDRLTDNSE
jgi:hypothetical protein